MKFVPPIVTATPSGQPLLHTLNVCSSIRELGQNENYCSLFSQCAKMGRRKLEIKKIEDKNSRQVTFSKRRNGLMKKAKELAVLCDVQVAAVIFSSRGKLYDFCSTNSLGKMLQQYHSYIETEENGSTGVGSREKHNLENTSLPQIKGLMQTVERDLEEPNVDQLNLTGLLHLEKQLEAALIQTKSRKTQLMMDSIKSLHKMEKMLREENKDLQNTIAAKTNSGMNEMMTEFGNLAHDSRMTSGQQQLTLNLL